MPGVTNSFRAQLDAIADNAAESLMSDNGDPARPFDSDPREAFLQLKRGKTSAPGDTIPPPPPVPAAWAGHTIEKPTADERSNVKPFSIPAGEPGIETNRAWTKDLSNKPIWETLSSPKSPEVAPPKAPKKIDGPDLSIAKQPKPDNQFDRPGRVLELSSANFDQALFQAKGPVLVDFYADWCGPCKQLSPKIDQLAKEYAGKASVFRVNVDHNPELAQRFGVQGVPALKVFEGGRIVEQASGDISRQALHQMLDKHLSRAQSTYEDTNSGGEQPRRSKLDRIKHFIDGLVPFSQREKVEAMNLTPYEQAAVDELNRVRVASGLNPLQFDPRLKLSALKKAEHANHRFDNRTNLHNSGPEGFRNPQQCFAQVGYNDYRECADTLSGGDYGPMFGPKDLMWDWLRSSSHRPILMGKADVVGIAVKGDKAFINVSSSENTRLPL